MSNLDFSQDVFATKDFTVTVENVGSTELPPSRQRAYFVRHRVHQVAHHVTNLLGEALMTCVALQKATEAVVKDPANPEFSESALPKAFGLN